MWNDTSDHDHTSEIIPGRVIAYNSTLRGTHCRQSRRHMVRNPRKTNLRSLRAMNLPNVPAPMYRVVPAEF